VKCTYGTGCGAHTGRNVKAITELLSTVAWTRAAAATQVEYALEGHVCNRACIQWLRDGLKLVIHGRTEVLACSVADTDGVYFVPALSGRCAPLGYELKGTFFASQVESNGELWCGVLSDHAYR